MDFQLGTGNQLPPSSSTRRVVNTLVVAPHRVTLVLLASWIAAACSPPTANGSGGESVGLTTAALISDELHSSGTSGFYFMPPMVAQPALSGSPDVSLAVTVEVDEIRAPDGTTVRTLVTFTTSAGASSEAIRYDNGSYVVNWHTDQFGLSTTATYRIRVLAPGGRELGFADVDVVKNGSELRNVETDEYVPLVNGKTLPIKFWIRQGVVGDGCTEGASRSLSCGVNGRGTQSQTCAAGQWANSGDCIDTDVCTDDATREVSCGVNGRGTQGQTCTTGQWSDTGVCVDPDICADDATREVSCGVNGRGTQAQVCATGQWANSGTCADPDQTLPAFPPDNRWTPLQINGEEIRDSNTDFSASGGRNLVGGSPINQPTALVTSDESYLYFRLRVQEAATANNSIWGCEIDVDGDTIYEYFVGYFSRDVSTKVLFNSSRMPGLAVVTQALTTYGLAFYEIEHAATPPTSNCWMSWAIPRASMNVSGFDVGLETPLRIICGSNAGDTAFLGGAASDVASTGTQDAFADPVVCNGSGCAR